MAKWIFTTDWHFGNADNSERHNENLLDYTYFLTEYAGKHGIENIAHLGDLFHQRDKLNVQTINYATEAIRWLAKHFKKKVFLKGNHDLYFRDTRIISSIEPFRESVHIVDDFEVIDGILFASWICDQAEFDKVVEASRGKKIVCGHFEFSQFLMNDNYEMEHGFDSKAFSQVMQVFSGHYHKRQHRRNITYIGNPFGFDFNDANDTERGFVVFDSDDLTWEFVNYSKVKVLSIPYETFMNKEEFDEIMQSAIPNRTTIRIEMKETVPDSVLEAVQAKLNDTLLASGSFVDYKGGKLKEILEQETDIGDISNLDDAVVKHLSRMDPVPDIDNELLVRLYRQAMTVDNERG